MKEQLLIGLWSKQMYDAMFARTHFTIDELLRGLREYEDLDSERFRRI